MPRDNFNIHNEALLVRFTCKNTLAITNCLESLCELNNDNYFWPALVALREDLTELFAASS